MASNSISGRQNRGRYWQVLIAIGILWLLLAAALLVYRQQTPSRVEITWETATEQGTAGFSLYRSQEEDGEFVLINEDNFIEGRGGPMTGATYSYTDDAVEAGNTYFYVLEEIELDGSRRRYEDDLFEYQVPATAGWLIVLIVSCGIMGIILLIAGLKEAVKK